MGKLKWLIDSILPTSVYNVLPVFSGLPLTFFTLLSKVKDKSVSEKLILTTSSGRNVLGRRNLQ